MDFTKWELNAIEVALEKLHDSWESEREDLNEEKTAGHRHLERLIKKVKNSGQTKGTPQ